MTKLFNNYSQNIEDKREELFENGFVQISSLDKQDIKKFENACDLVRKKPTPFKMIKKSEGGEFFMDYNNWRRHKEVFELCSSKK